ncbi:penicillin-binding protein 1B [Photobacterium iliopiscarium]|jgi:penicillin-binding protein 1B|uniref:Penicillin-binding protein 1B n=1 Tax=Photobacterium iliopiscarium TaxID=56192 RepID=A0ABX5GP94_9GAMM|nr:penicillin-binding protein 1B [Photobacterium iliopiscarium]PST95815.1 penicillin-binding protein 1B [Photobacterium iliopiscarium]PSW92926.1 penicillin-binding protein 1B [Photobacterium iliopiscarium]
MTSNNQQSSPQVPQIKKKRSAIVRALIGATLIGTAGMAYLGYNLNQQIGAKFAGQLWQLPSVVYAREMALQPGAPITYNTLVNELKVLGYQKVAHPDQSGEYAANGWKVDFVRRPFNFKEGPEGARHVSVSFNNDSITRIMDLDSNRELGFLHIDPKMLGMLEAHSDEQRIYLPEDKMPKLLVAGLIDTEDRHFYEHDGISLVGIARAFVANIKAGHTVQGGSTLTQQLAKNMFLSNQRSFWRKFKEAYMAIIIDTRYGKQEVLDAYMNQVYLAQFGGHGIHGFALASRYYFDRPLSELRVDQLALLIGMVKGPTYYNPWRHPVRAKERRNIVLSLMNKNGEISDKVYQASIKLPLDIQEKGQLAKRQPAYFDQIKTELEQKAGAAFEAGKGLRIFTSLDPQSQKLAEAAVAKIMPEVQKRAGKDLQTAVVIVDRTTGEIRAMIGGDKPGFAGYNRAINAQRQVGSVIKPALYLSALENPARFSLATSLKDQPLSIKMHDGATWSPRNYDRKYRGEVPLFVALAKSYNVPTVNLGMAVGVDKVTDTLTKLGIPREAIPQVPSLFLGSISLSPLDVAQMYQGIGNEGSLAPLTALNAVVDENGKVLYQNWPKAAEVVPSQAAWLTMFALQDTVKFGTAHSLNKLFPNTHLAGKTGTTNNGRDSWYVGIDGREVVTVWMGRDDNKSTHLTGASGALRLYTNYIQHRKPEPLLLRQPANIEAEKYNIAADGEYIPSCIGKTRMPIWDPHGDLKQNCQVEKVKDKVEKAKHKVEGFFNNLFNW